MSTALLQQLLLQLSQQLGQANCVSGSSKPASRKRCRLDDDDDLEALCSPKKRAKVSPSASKTKAARFTKSNLNDVLDSMRKEDLAVLYNQIVTDGYVSKKNKDQLVNEITSSITSLSVLKRGLSALYKDSLVLCVDSIGESWSRMSKEDAISYILDYCK
jgi:hypothetical protein